MAQSIVMLIHGHRAPRYWRREVVTALAERRMIPYVLHYGRAAALQFALPWTRQRLLARFQESMEEIVQHAGIQRPSILCHGIGTWLACELLQRQPELKLDKLILVDPDVRPDYPWAALLADRRINSVVTERVDSGRPATMQTDAPGHASFPASHSSWTDQTGMNAGPDSVPRFERWCQYLAQPSISVEDEISLRYSMAEARSHLANRLSVDADDLDTAVYLDGQGELVLSVQGRTDSCDPAALQRRVSVADPDSMVARAFRENRVLHFQQDGEAAVATGNGPFVAAAPLRLPGDGRVFGVLLVRTSSTVGEPDSAGLASTLMSAATEMGSALANRSTGY